MLKHAPYSEDEPPNSSLALRPSASKYAKVVVLSNSDQLRHDVLTVSIAKLYKVVDIGTPPPSSAKASSLLMSCRASSHLPAFPQLRSIDAHDHGSGNYTP